MSYKYEGIELMSDIFADLLLQLFSCKQFTRNECIDAIKKYHIEHGGICNKKSYITTFKHATASLRKKGYDVTNPAYSVWRINKKYDGYVSYRDENAKTSMTMLNDEDINDDVLEEVGSGGETIYVYYYPVYKCYALSKGENNWYCKVGMTTKNIWDRIYSQAGTCFPEEPFVALIIKCDDAHKLEQILHNILKLKNKWVETAPGKEWFVTSPEEIKKIYFGVISSDNR